MPVEYSKEFKADAVGSAPSNPREALSQLVAVGSVPLHPRSRRVV